ncbi:hypothetical protein V2O64_14615 [Verrucomicrobiaceae bacterium 227]
MSERLELKGLHAKDEDWGSKTFPRMVLEMELAVFSRNGLLPSKLSKRLLTTALAQFDFCPWLSKIGRLRKAAETLAPGG